MKEKYLPLGSIVLLEGGQKRLMITGYHMKTIEEPNRIFDYCGCVFPEGTIRSDCTCVFDHSQIEKVFSIGYIDDTSSEFIKKLKGKNFGHNISKNSTDLQEKKRKTYASAEELLII